MIRLREFAELFSTTLAPDFAKNIGRDMASKVRLAPAPRRRDQDFPTESAKRALNECALTVESVLCPPWQTLRPLPGGPGDRPKSGPESDLFLSGPLSGRC